MSSRPQAWIYVQHLLGQGHLRRAVTLAQALHRAGWVVRLVSGGMPVAGLASGIDFVQLPPVRVADARFDAWLDEKGRAVQADAEWRARRCRALLQSLRELAGRPRLLILETFPFGRRAFRFELLPLLEYTRALQPRPVIVCSVRDIVQSRRRPQRITEAVDWANRYFDAVWVHGDEKLVRFGESFSGAGQLTVPITYTGYLHTPGGAAMQRGAGDAAGDSTDNGASGAAAGMAEGAGQCASSQGADEIIVSAGGGAAGFALYQVALLTARAMHDYRWRILLGAHYDSAQRDALQGLATEVGTHATVEDNRADFAALLQRCACSVSRAGYNTVLDLLHHRPRTVLVPFEEHGESEQLTRARALQRRGQALVLREKDLNADALATTVAAALGAPPPPPLNLRTDGADTCVELANALL